MKTITIKLFTIDELDEKARAKAMEAERSFVAGNFTGDYVTEKWKSDLEDMGYTDPEIFWSGFNSQGDGACFEATVDIKRWLKGRKLASRFGLLKKHASDGNITVKHGGHYHHENSMSVDEDFGSTSESLDRQLTEFLELIENDVSEVAHEIYKDLERAWDAELDDESILENIRANDYTYESNGEMRNE